MTSSHSTPAQPRSAPATPGPRWQTTLGRWPDAIAVAVLLGIFAMTIRAALSRQDATGVGAAIGVVVLVGGAVAQRLDDRAHGHRAPRQGDTWR